MGRSLLFSSSLLVAACGAGAGSSIASLEITIEGEGFVDWERGPNADPLSGTCPSECADEFRANGTFPGWHLIAEPAVTWELDRWSECNLDPVSDERDAEVDVGRQSTCLVVFRMCDGSDPRDLADDPDGDATLDLRCVFVGTNDDGSLWVRVRMESAWDPPPVYSWYTTVTLRSASGTIGSRTEELHDGVRSTITDGAVTEANSSTTPNAGGVPGYEMGFESAIVGDVAFVDVETGILKVQGGNFRMDGVVTVEL